MDGGFPGLGTVINVVAVLVGATVGMLAGHRLRVDATRAELERIAAAPGLSKDTFEQVSKSLG